MRSRPVAQHNFTAATPLAAAQRTQMGRWETDSLLLPVRAGDQCVGRPLSHVTMLSRPGRQDHPRHLPGLGRAPVCPPSPKPDADNGSLNADHASASEQRHIPSFFFCHPNHSWEKDPVENINGLIRRYLPKPTDLSHIPEDDLDAIAAELNQRPRICLAFRMPAEVLFE